MNTKAAIEINLLNVAVPLAAGMLLSGCGVLLPGYPAASSAPAPRGYTVYGPDGMTTVTPGTNNGAIVYGADGSMTTVTPVGNGAYSVIGDNGAGIVTVSPNP